MRWPKWPSAATSKAPTPPGQGPQHDPSGAAGAPTRGDCGPLGEIRRIHLEPGDVLACRMPAAANAAAIEDARRQLVATFPRVPVLMLTGGVALERISAAEIAARRRLDALPQRGASTWIEPT